MEKEKSKKKKGVKYLYLYISISFLIAMSVVILATLLYFGYIRKNILGISYNPEIVGQIIDETSIEQMLSGLKSALIYGIMTGLILIFFVTSHIIRPIRKITSATKKVASGDFNAIVDINRNDEIGKLADNFNLMIKELNSIEYLRKDFLSNISHELKTPISSIQGFTKLLAKENLSKEEKQEYIDIIIEETTRLSNLSNNMIKLTNFENQEIVTNKKEYRLDEQIRRCIIMLEEKINEKNIKVELDTEEIIITEDADLIMEVWINLLSNAIKYSNKNGNIDIKITEDTGYFKVQIKDDGIGIPKDKQDRIFEKFFQVEKSHSYDGSGLGLAIVKRIIDLTDGKIEFESKEGTGTCFWVYLKK